MIILVSSTNRTIRGNNKTRERDILKLHNLYFSHNVVSRIKSRRIKWERHVAHMRK
jgi:hypothetical protein